MSFTLQFRAWLRPSNKWMITPESTQNLPFILEYDYPWIRRHFTLQVRKSLLLYQLIIYSSITTLLLLNHPKFYSRDFNIITAKLMEILRWKLEHFYSWVTFGLPLIKINEYIWIISIITLDKNLVTETEVWISSC